MPTVDPLLPNEPRVPDWEAQQDLTERFLLPARGEIETLFVALRNSLDPIWSRVRPVKLGKPYPLGQCLEISLAMQVHLSRLDPSGLSGAPARGFQALRAFQQAGGRMRQVWGDLRGQYFQNAYLAGSLYIDCANDTVVPTKPKVEILPLAEADFRPVEDFLHYARIAGSYWRALAFPNHLLPEAAPWCPLLLAIPGGGLQLHSQSRYMLALTRSRAFAPSEAVLQAPPLQPGLFRLAAERLAAGGIAVPPDPEAGRAAALQACARARGEAAQHSDRRAAEAAAAAGAATARLLQLQVSAAGTRTP